MNHASSGSLVLRAVRPTPQLDVSWYVFKNEHTGPTQTAVLPPDCGEALPAWDGHGDELGQELAAE